MTVVDFITTDLLCMRLCSDLSQAESNPRHCKAEVGLSILSSAKACPVGTDLKLHPDDSAPTWISCLSYFAADSCLRICKLSIPLHLERRLEPGRSAFGRPGLPATR